MRRGGNNKIDEANQDSQRSVISMPFEHYITKLIGESQFVIIGILEKRKKKSTSSNLITGYQFLAIEPCAKKHSQIITNMLNSNRIPETHSASISEHV